MFARLVTCQSMVLLLLHWQITRRKVSQVAGQMWNVEHSSFDFQNQNWKSKDWKCKSHCEQALTIHRANLLAFHYSVIYPFLVRSELQVTLVHLRIGKTTRVNNSCLCRRRPLLEISSNRFCSCSFWRKLKLLIFRKEHINKATHLNSFVSPETSWTISQ